MKSTPTLPWRRRAQQQALLARFNNWLANRRFTLTEPRSEDR